MIKPKIITLVPDQNNDIYDQTINVFEKVSKYFNSIIRIWVKLNNIDDNYSEFSRGRNFVFEKYGYAFGKRTFVSTCVGSKNPLTVTLLIAPEIKPEQINFIDMPSYLPHTNVYNVSFERGNRIEFGNCTQYYISGTASIDENGDILHKGDIKKQIQRIILIIKKMLNKHNENLDTILYMKWYVRNISDLDTVKEEVLKLKYFNKNIDFYFEQAEICRPEWLVEAECFAHSPTGNKEFEDFAYEI